MTQQQQILFHLNLILGIGPAVVNKLLGTLNPKALSDIYSYSITEFLQLGFSNPIAEKLYKGLQDKEFLEKELSLLEKHHDIKIITLLDDDYPELLINAHCPPAILYCKGALKKQEKSLAIVGARKTNGYGQNAIDEVVPTLISGQWTIVSGGARGADTFAHKAALQNNGRTISIIGSGLLKPYPYENKRLFDQIVYNGGALVSSFPLQVDPLPANFPARNRIISGMSLGCLVVQAAAKSGARITAQFALEQGREVFAIPGSIYDPLSAGCHALLKEGAKVTASANDILEEFGEVISKEKKERAKEVVMTIPTALPEPKQKIISLCSQSISIDELAEKTELSYLDLQNELFSLQLEGYIKQDFTGLWIVQ